MQAIESVGNGQFDIAHSSSLSDSLRLERVEPNKKVIT